MINVADLNKLKKSCIERVRHYVDLGNNKLGIRLPYPNISFDLGGTTAGMAFYGTNQIKFQPVLMFENAEDFLAQTAGHEVGHLLARYKYRQRNITPHGDEWKSVMWTLGLPANRCHNYDTASVTGQRRSNRTPKRIQVSGGTARVANGFLVVDLD